jgi:hypothetical protein
MLKLDRHQLGVDQVYWIENGEKALTCNIKESTICWDT